MALRRGSHRVYDTQYHLVWAPKYRKKILTGIVGERIRELLLEIAESYRIEIEELEVSMDHVPIFCSFAPKYSITQVVTRFKSLSARAIFREQPQIENSRKSSVNCGVANFGKTATLLARWAIR